MRALAGRRIYLHAVCFLGGAAVVQWAPVLPSAWVALPVVVLIAFCVRFRWLLPLASLSLGCLWAIVRADMVLDHGLPPELERKRLHIGGTVASLVQTDERYLKFTVRVESMRHREKSYPSPGLVQLRWYDPDRDVRIGQGWRFTVRLKRPHGFQNPGGFDYERWLFLRRIRATGYVLSSDPHPALDRRTRVQVWREAVQRYLLHAGLRNGSVLSALTIGERGGLASARREVLRRTGTSHLLAISGLHVGFVSGLLFIAGLALGRTLGVATLWWPAPKTAALLAVCGAAFYALLAGFSVPTQRAVVMVSVFMLALLLDRSVHAARNLAVALFVVLIIDPLSVLDAGFWLSFGALASILTALRATQQIKSRWLRVVLVQCAITVMLAPLTLLFFGQVSLCSPLANLIAIPVVAFAVVPLALCAAGALGLGWHGAAGALFGLADAVLRGLWPVLAALAHPDWVVWVHAPGKLAVLTALIGAFWLYGARTWIRRAPGAILVLPLVWGALGGTPRQVDLATGSFRVTVLDVGQGLAIVVRTEGHVLLYDTGARFSARFDAGAAVVVPYLRAQGVDRLDMLIITHGDNDHIGGLRAVLGAVAADRRLTSVRHRVPGAEACVSGQTWRWDGVEFKVLSPDSADPPRHNNASCVLSIRGQHGAALLTGDIERAVEARLTAGSGGALRSDVLLVPHQGSKTSSSPGFIDAVSPRLAIVSAGYLNRYGHPAPTVLDRYRERGIGVLNTAQAGAIDVDVSADGIQARRYRERHKRYWFDG